MGEGKTFGILLKKTVLPNDDAALEFFTEKFGKITVFARKFARSKKQAEVDYFRVLELVFFQGRSSKTLRNVSTHTVFHGFSKSYESMETGFSWLNLLQKNFPPEKEVPDFFRFCCHLFRQFELAHKNIFYAYFFLQICRLHGWLPRFDLVRSDVYCHPITKEISATKIEGATFFSNRQRQIIEFLRRSDLDIFLEKFEKFESTELVEIVSFLEKVEH